MSRKVPLRFETRFSDGRLHLLPGIPLSPCEAEVFCQPAGAFEIYIILSEPDPRPNVRARKRVDEG